MCLAVAATGFPLAASAQDASPQDRAAHERQADESRWVASLAATSGVFLQAQDGSLDACLFADPADATGSCPAPGSTPLRPPSSDEDLGIVAFVGANLEVMTPSLPLPTRPRLFLSGEILPTFSALRNVAGDGDPECVRGPQQNDPCERDGDASVVFGEDDANGQGTVVSTEYDLLSFGANFGIAFPVRVGERQVRIKPSAGWLSYEAEVSGKVVDAACLPPNRCIDSTAGPGLLRETVLRGSESKRFHAIGPGLDVEMDTGRFGPLGTSIFLAGHAYRTLGDRTVEVDAMEIYPNDGLPLANQAVAARWGVDFDPWVYRLGVGLRIQWLGPAN